MADDGKEFYPTVAECYLTEIAKLSFALKDYEKCIYWSTKAIDEIKKLMYNNVIWLRRISAFSWQAIGEKQKALEEMFWVVEKKNDWFLNFELAKILLENNELEACKFFVMKTIADRQITLFKIHFYEFVTTNEIFLNTQMNKKIEQLSKELKTHKANTQTAIDLQNSLIKEAEEELNKVYKGKVYKEINNNSFLVELDKKFDFAFDEILLAVGSIYKEEEIFYCKNPTKKTLKKGDKVEIKLEWSWNKKRQEVNKTAKLL